MTKLATTSSVSALIGVLLSAGCGKVDSTTGPTNERTPDSLDTLIETYVAVQESFVNADFEAFAQLKSKRK